MISLVLATLLGTSGTSLATTSITLEQVREESRKNTPAQQAELEAARASEQFRFARASILPQVGLQLGAGYGAANQLCFQQGGVLSCTTTGATRVGGNFNGALTLSQLLFDGGRWWNQIAQASTSEDAAREQLREQRMSSEYEGIRRYYELYRAQRTLDVLRASEKRSTEQLVRANALFDAGRMQKTEAIAAEVNLGNDQMAVLRQRARLAGAQAELAVWLARPGREDLVAAEPTALGGTSKTVPEFGAALSLANEQRPVLKALALQAKAAALATSVARGAYWPRLSGVVSYSRAGVEASSVFGNPSQNYSLSAGLSLQWDVFRGLADQAQVGIARQQQTLAELNWAQAQRELEGDLRRSLLTLEASLATLEIAARNTSAAAKGVTLAEERFKAGAGSTLEVRDAQLKLTQAELANLESRIDVEIARANLDRVMGTLGNGVMP